MAEVQSFNHWIAFTPTALQHIAQGCAATLGSDREPNIYPERVASRGQTNLFPGTKNVGAFTFLCNPGYTT